MYHVTSKNLLPMCVLKILQEHSDSNHPMKQAEILQYLESEYNLKAERKAIGRAIEHLREQLDIQIESNREGCWYDDRLFENSELRLLIDAVMSGRYIKPNYTKELIDKLSSLGGKKFKNHIKNIYVINEAVKGENAELFDNIEKIDGAISDGLKIKFQYCEYDIHKKLEPYTPVKLSPYRILLHEGMYYLIGYCEDEYNEGLQSYKIDHLKDIVVLWEKGKSFSKVNQKISESEFIKQILEDPIMGLEKPKIFKFYAKKFILDEIIEYFGKNVSITETDKVPEWMFSFNESLLVEVKTSFYAMRKFALENISTVQVIEPIELEGELRAMFIDAGRRYGSQQGGFYATDEDYDAVDNLPLHTKAAFGIPILFGDYPFTADGDRRMIEWTPLRFEEDRVLLITRCCIDVLIFDEKNDNITWRDSYLRKWMNEVFYEDAFSPEEKAQILTTTLKNPDDEYSQELFVPVTMFQPKESPQLENYETNDKVFALSTMEAFWNFPSDEERMTLSTDYVRAKCEKEGWTRQNSWWLRTPSWISNRAAAVYSFGSITGVGEAVNHEMVAVRPAIWVKKEKRGVDFARELCKDVSILC